MDDRSAGGKSELVLFQIGPVHGEEIARIQRPVAQVLPNGRVELVAPGTGRYDEQATSETAVLRAEIAGQNLEFLNRVG